MIKLFTQLIIFFVFCSTSYAQMLTVEASDFQSKDDSTEFNDILTLSLEDLLNVQIESAGKQAEKISEIPASIVLITRNDIQKHGYHSLEDIISNIPGFYSLGDAFLFGGTNFGVRGFASPGAFNNVMILINGVNQMEDFSNGFSTDKINIPVQAIDRIEVIRGPMAVLYGSNAFMGVINIITNEVQVENNKTESIVSTSYGSLNSSDLFLQLKGKEENVTYSFNAGLEQTDGRNFAYNDIISNPSLSPLTKGVDGKRSTKQLSESAKYMNFSTTIKDFSFYADISESNKGFISVLPSLNFEKGKNNKVLGSNFQAKYDKKLTDKMTLSLKYTYSYYNFSGNTAEYIHPNFYAILGVTSKAQEVEANLFYNISDNINLSFGLYNRNAGTVDRFVDSPTLGIPNENTFLDNSINTFAGFSQITYTPFDKLKIVGGLRVEQTGNHLIIRETTISDTLGRTFTSDYNYPLVETNKPQFIPRLSAIYNFNSRNILKVMYAQSKKRAAFVENDNAFGSDSPNLTFANMTTFELNYLKVWHKSISTNFSVYNNILDNLVIRTVEVLENSVNTKVANSGKMNTMGSELTINIKPTDKLQADISGTYQYTTDKSSGMDTLDAAYAPKFLGYLKMSYNVTDKISIGIKGKYVDKIYSEYNFAENKRYGNDAPSYFTLDANVRATLWKGLFVNVLASNLTNTQIRYVASQNNPWMDLGMLGYERRIRATLGYKF